VQARAVGCRGVMKKVPGAGLSGHPSDGGTSSAVLRVPPPRQVCVGPIPGILLVKRNSSDVTSTLGVAGEEGDESQLAAACFALVWANR